MTPNKIFITRHGESLGNVDWRTYFDMEDKDIPLTSKGKIQAATLALELNKRVTTSVALLSSTYFRAIQTAQVVHGMLGNKIFRFDQHEDLRELRWCDGKGQPNEAIQMQQRKNMGPFKYANPTGESPFDVWKRQKNVLDALQGQFADPGYPQNLIIVCHGITMITLLMHLTGIPQKEYETIATPQNCEVVELVQAGKRWAPTIPIRRK